MSTHDTLMAIYNKIRTELYLCRDDLLVDGHSLSSTLLLQSPAFPTHGRARALGEYATGKKTLGKILSCTI